MATLTKQELVNQKTMKPDDKGLLTQHAYSQRKRRELQAEQSSACSAPNADGHALACSWGLGMNTMA